MSCKKIPDGVTQHKTAGPYSPILEVEANKLVLISGQAPIDMDGNVVGETIEEQTEYTLASSLPPRRRCRVSATPRCSHRGSQAPFSSGPQVTRYPSGSPAPHPGPRQV